VSLVLLATAGFAQAPDLSKMDVVLRSVPDGPIARVNGESIPSTAFVDLYSQELRKIEKTASVTLPDGERIELALFCMYELVEDELLFQEARTRKIEIPSDAVKKAFKAQIKRMETTEAEVIKRLGFSDQDEVLRDIERILLINKVSEQIVKKSDLEITDDEVDTLYEEQKGSFTQDEMLSIRHMFFRASEPKPGSVKESAHDRAKSAMALLRSGQRFGAVWESQSDRMNSGDTGILRAPINTLPPFLVDVAMKLEPNKISSIIESKSGFHIIQMIEFTPGKEADPEMAKPLLRIRLYSQKANDVIRDYVWGLIEGVAEVQQFLDLDNNVAFADQDRR
jgi:parvulin-like peptidyl-prolyl isomerase